MFTTTENRPMVGRAFSVVTFIVGAFGVIGTMAGIVYVLIVGRGSDAAAAIALLSAASLGILILGIPSGLYGLWCNRSRFGWFALALCFIPFLACLPLSLLAGGGAR